MGIDILREGDVMIEDLFSLDGRLAVVTGASGAIGREAAKVFLQLGAEVIMTGRTPEHLEDARSSLPEDAPIHVLLGDARDREHVNEIFRLTESRGGADILVNSVGTNIRKPILEATPEDLDLLWSVNMASVWAITQALAPQMVAKRYGKIINMCSIGSFIGLQSKTMYAITKGALAQHTRSAAVELAEYGIRVNGIAPGYVDTPMTHAWIHSEREAEFLSAIPLNRFAEVEDLDGAFAYLASKASDHMTGQLLVLDGGETV